LFRGETKLDLLPVASVKPNHGQIRRERVVAGEDLAEVRHVVAFEKNETEAVLSEEVEEALAQVVRIPRLDGVLEAARGPT